MNSKQTVNKCYASMQALQPAHHRIYMAIGDEESWPHRWLAWLKLSVRA